MEQMQFTAVVLLTLLLVKLLLMPNKVVVNPVVGMARWLMTIGIALLDVHFLLQYTLGLRAMGVTHAVFLNLLMFIPSSWVISLAVIYLQRQGQVSRFDKIVGGVTWSIVILLLGIAIVIDGQTLSEGIIRSAEMVASFFYLAMQSYYAFRQIVNLRAMRLALQNYYDHDMDGILVWMKYSTIVLMILALMAPLLIFTQRKELAIFAVLFFVGIFYLVDTFCNYMVSSAPMKMAKAELSEKGMEVGKRPAVDRLGHETEATTDTTASAPSVTDVHSELIRKWVEKGGYRRNGLTMPSAAEEIGLPRYLLSLWLKQQNLTYATWMTDLRIEEAKRVMKAHLHWTNEAIAQHCGFNDRSYFQKKFKEKTGQSPAEFHG